LCGPGDLQGQVCGHHGMGIWAFPGPAKGDLWVALETLGVGLVGTAVWVPGHGQVTEPAMVTPLGDPEDPQGQVCGHHDMGIWPLPWPAKGDLWVALETLGVGLVGTTGWVPGHGQVTEPAMVTPLGDPGDLQGQLGDPRVLPEARRMGRRVLGWKRRRMGNHGKTHHRHPCRYCATSSSTCCSPSSVFFPCVTGHHRAQ